VKQYLTFNGKKDLKEAMKHFYEKLREAENCPDIQYIFISHLDESEKDAYHHFEFYDTL
jgi:hypothetical protein